MPNALPRLPLPTVPGEDESPAGELAQAGRAAGGPIGEPPSITPRTTDETTGRIVFPVPDPPWDDPRPDLTGDRGRWWVLLQAAYRLDDGTQTNSLFGILQFLRRCGARLEIAGPANWSLAPEGPLPNWRLVKGDELTEAEYQEFRDRYLVPHKATLTKLLTAPAAIAHAPLAPGEPPLTGRGVAQPGEPLPRKNGHDTAQPALLEVEAAGAGADRRVGGDW